MSIVMALSVLALSLLRWDGTSAWFTSPVSPVLSPVYSPLPVEGTPVTLTLAEQTAPLRLAHPLLRASFWSSPLPWVAVGLPLFGLLAWVLTVLLRRSRSDGP